MSDTAQEQPQDKWQVRFFTIWIGQAFSVLGSSLVGFAFVWYLTAQTGSATVLAIGSLISKLPNVIVSPFAGTLVDRWNRKAVMMIFDSITALFTLLLAVLFLMDSVQVWHIYLVMFIRSTCGQFQWAAITASTSLMVPKSQLSRVAGMNQTLNGTMNIIAPAMGAFLIDLMPTQGILMIDVSTAALAVIPLLFFKIPQPVRAAAGEAGKPDLRTTVWQDLVEGWKYISNWSALMGVILIAMLANFLINPAFSLLPLVVTEHFSKGAYELGLVNSVFGIGVILGGLVLSAWGGFKNRIFTSMSALTLSGVGVLIVGLAPSNLFFMSIIGMAMFGFLNPIVNGPLFTVIQENVEPEIQGRVFSFLSAGSALASPLGLAIAGPVSDATSTQFWFIVGGSLTVVLGIASLFVPVIREFGKGHRESPAVAPTVIEPALPIDQPLRDGE
ncbi:MAG: MFS transporter [Chloroflexota bacterium]|nr:MFS transporter [Chloroflexota bacterium]